MGRYSQRNKALQSIELLLRSPYQGATCWELQRVVELGLFSNALQLLPQIVQISLGKCTADGLINDLLHLHGTNPI